MKMYKLLRSTLAILVIFFCIQGFNVLLSASTLDGLITDSVLSGYRSVCTQLENTIERGLRFGKPLDGFVGMDAYIRNTSGTIKGIPLIAVLSKDGTLLYTDKDVQDDTPLHSVFQEYIHADATGEKKGSQWIEYEGEYYDVHVLEGIRGEVHGYLLLKMKQKVIQDARDAFVQVNILVVISLALAVGIAQTGWLTFIMSSATRTDPARLRVSIKWLLLLIIGGAQLLYALPTLSFFGDEIDRYSEYKAQLVGTPLARDLEFLVQKKVDFTKIRGLEGELSRIVNDNPEISGAWLEYEGENIAQYGEFRESEGLVTVPIYTSWPNRYTPREVVGRIRMVENRAYVNAQLRSLTVDLGTTLVICLILLGELASLFAMFAGLKGNDEEAVAAVPPAPAAVSGLDKTLLMRGMCFLLFFGYDLVLTFIPLAARDLGGSLLGLSPSIISSLPISAEMAMAGVGILLVGTLSRRVGWSTLFAAGVVCAALGGFLAAFSPNVLVFIGARGVAGLGFGLALMSGQLSLLSTGNRAEGLGNMFAGIFAGSLCGCAAGAMLSEHFGYSTVFLVAGLMIPLSLFILPAMRGSGPSVAKQAKRPQRALLTFLKEPRLWALLLMVSLPAAACLSGFLYFIVPVQMVSIGVNQGDIGRLFMIYGLCFIYAGPIIGKMVDRATSTAWYVVLAGVLTGVALLVASEVPTLWGYAASVVCTGIAQCIVASSILVYVLSLPSVQALGAERSASMFRLIERGGQVLGPMLFAGLLGTMNFGSNLFLVGAAIVFAGLLFVTIARKKPATA